MRIKWHRREPGEYYATLDDATVGVVVRTGSPQDEQPWDWYLTIHDGAPQLPETVRKESGVADSMRSAMSYVEAAIADG